MNQSITIADTAIHQDEHGRYNLNDLHHAAGGEKRYKPSNFLRLVTTQALIDEINQVSDMRSGEIPKSQIRALESVHGGNARGSYACRELVYAYAMWISAKFYLQVIRTYNALVTGQLVLPDLGLAQENGELRDIVNEQAAVIADIKDELLDCYRSKSPVRKVKTVLKYKVPTAALELMAEYRIPRERIAAVCGISRLCLRQHIHNARDAGRLQ